MHRWHDKSDGSHLVDRNHWAHTGSVKHVSVNILSMTSAFSVWLVIGLAFLFANLPFFNERFLCVVPLKSGEKTWWVRLFELLVLYLLAGAVGKGIEYSNGQIYPQNWEFYAITASMFLTFAFPGFVYRYLTKRR